MRARKDIREFDPTITQPVPLYELLALAGLLTEDVRQTQPMPEHELAALRYEAALDVADDDDETEGEDRCPT
jgi:hypothetical protein